MTPFAWYSGDVPLGGCPFGNPETGRRSIDSTSRLRCFASANSIRGPSGCKPIHASDRVARRVPRFRGVRFGEDSGALLQFASGSGISRTIRGWSADDGSTIPGLVGGPEECIIEIAVVAACFVFFLFSIVAHEVAHGWVAFRLGDPTARDLGRLTFNPIVHVDPVFSLVVPVLTYLTLGFPFGGAKPIPVVLRNLKHPARDDVLVTLAGPLTNLVIAGVFGAVLHLPFFRDAGVDNGAVILIGITVYVNLLLALFNLMPIPPLDGSHILAYALPEPLRSGYRALGSAGILILFALLYGVPAFRDAFWGALQGAWVLLGHSTDRLADILVRFAGLRRGMFEG